MSVASTSPHQAATVGAQALTSAIGFTGHVLQAKTRDVKLKGKTAAALADQVLPALTEAVALLNAQDPAEADNFRAVIAVAIDAAATTQGHAGPVAADMARKITAAIA
ncbi:hypothetical protein [Nocardia acididurans]|nr:hypothetical protein [Nocardia acididurans]